jgi:hypothetical protein
MILATGLNGAARVGAAAGVGASRVHPAARSAAQAANRNDVVFMVFPAVLRRPPRVLMHASMTAAPALA